jgi:Flp pilus assembly protein TadG
VRRLRTDEGTIAIWLLGLAICLLFVGGLSVDLWRVLGERRALAGAADAASLAGASALDEDAFRAGGVIALDPGAARARALAHVAAQPPAAHTGVVAAAEPDGVVVTLEGRVPLTLLRVLVPSEQAVVDLRVTAVAAPQRP